MTHLTIVQEVSDNNHGFFTSPSLSSQVDTSSYVGGGMEALLEWAVGEEHGFCNGMRVGGLNVGRCCSRFSGGAEL